MCIFVAIVCGHQLDFQGLISNARETFEPKTSATSQLKLQNLAENVSGWGREICQFFCHMGDLTSRQNIQNPKNTLQKSFSSRSYSSLKWNSCAAQFPHHDSDPVNRLL